MKQPRTLAKAVAGVLAALALTLGAAAPTATAAPDDHSKPKIQTRDTGWGGV